MAKLSKRIRAFKEKVDPEKSYPFDEAVGLLKELATAKFNETVEVAVNLGVDAKKSDQGVRGATTLPHGTGSDVRVAVFTQGEAADPKIRDVNLYFTTLPLSSNQRKRNLFWSSGCMRTVRKHSLTRSPT